MKIRYFIITFFIMLALVSQVNAETLYFVDGREIKVEIVQKDDYYIVVNQDGRTRKYYTAEIKRIEEDIVDLEVIEDIDMDKFQFTRESKVEWILKLMDINGTRDVLKENIDRIVEAAPDERKEEIKNIFDLDGLLEELVPIFIDHYTEEEVKEMVAFYETPTGTKMLKETPIILREVTESMVRFFAARAKK